METLDIIFCQGNILRDIFLNMVPAFKAEEQNSQLEGTYKGQVQLSNHFRSYQKLNHVIKSFI